MYPNNRAGSTAKQQPQPNQQLQTGIVPGQPYQMPAGPQANKLGQYPAPLSAKPNTSNVGTLNTNAGVLGGGGGGGNNVTPTKPVGSEWQMPASQFTGPTSKPDHEGGGGKKHHRMSAIEKYLAGDEVYGDQISALDRLREQYQVTNKRSRQDIRQDFRTAIGNMNTQRERDLAQMQEDFAARGIINSGVYGTRQGEYETDFGRSMNDLTTDRGRNLTELLEQLKQFKGNVRDQRMSARQEAIRRRAVELGLT